MKFRDYICLLTLYLVSFGLIFSAVHDHDTSFNQVDSDTGLEIVEDHNFCPICGIIFDGIIQDVDHKNEQVLSDEYLILTSDQVIFSENYNSKDGRSPPNTV